MSSYNFSSSMFIGDTSQGIPQPVFFDPHTQIFNDKPPGTLITGQPGSGKSYLAMTLTAMSAILGKTTIVLDPKGDFISLMNLKQDIGSFNLWNLSDKKRRGILDPFRMAKDPGDQLDLAVSLIEIFTGGLTGEERTALAPIVKDVIKENNPSLALVVQELRGSQRPAARDLGTTLDLIQSLPLAGLCFAPAGAVMEKVSIDEGLTVVTLVGMDMPKEGGKDNKSKLSTGILFLLTDYIRRLMVSESSRVPKTLVIDEAWAILQTPAGAQVVKEVALLGRSKNLAMILVTQNNSHLKNLDIESTIATRFAFSSSEKEAVSIVGDMQLPPGEGFAELITNLAKGECLMKDWSRRYSSVQISNWRKDWDVAFKNNPLEKARAEREAREKTS
jgi:DNA helicase HerA-like ATPase